MFNVISQTRRDIKTHCDSGQPSASANEYEIQGTAKLHVCIPRWVELFQYKAVYGFMSTSCVQMQ